MADVTGAAATNASTSSNYTNYSEQPTIQFSGLASGIDTTSIIDALVKAEQASVNRIEYIKSTWELKVQALQDYNDKLRTFQSSVEELNSMEEFYSRNALSSDESVAEVTNNSLAQPGSYSLTVGSNINHKLASNGVANASTEVYTIGSATTVLEFTINGNTITITDTEASNYDSTSGDNDGSISVDELIGLINSDSANSSGGSPLYVEASSLNDNSTSNPVRLVLTALNGGSDNRINITTNNTSLNLTSNSIDEVEDIVGTTGSSLVTSGGTYLGNTNKSINFEVIQGGDLSAGDTIKIKWTDNELGKTGVIETSSSGTFDVEQGLQITLSNGTYTEGDKFKIDLWHPDLQKAQDNGLAQVEKELHSGVASSDTIINDSGSVKYFAYRYAGGDVVKVAVSDGATLQDLVDAINEDSNNPGVIATIVNDGQGLSNSYHLVLTGKNQGAAYTIDIVDSDTTLDGSSGTVDFTSSTFTETQSAQNAMVRLDGFPTDSTEYIQEMSNTITDLIHGVTIYLKSTGTTNITVTNDFDEIKEKIQNFVDAYNDMVDYMEEITKYDSQTEEAGPLQGNYAAQFVEYDVMRITTSPGTGFKSINSLESPPGSEYYISLADIGIKTGDDKKLEIDEGTLDEALQNHLDDVALLFGADGVGRNDTSTNKITYDSHVKNLTEAGVYEVEVTVSGGAITSATINGHDATINGNYIVGQSGYSEAGLQLLVDTSSDGTYSAEIRLLKGITNELNDRLDDILKEKTGPLNVLIDNYNEIIENMDKKIEREQIRIESLKNRLIQQFTAMEDMLAQYNAQSQYLMANIGKLPAVG